MYDKIAGRMICIMTMTGMAFFPMDSILPIWPTSPLVPIPAPTGVFVILNTTVAIGPRMALDIIGGRKIQGFLTIFPICSMEVPKL